MEINELLSIDRDRETISEHLPPKSFIPNIIDKPAHIRLGPSQNQRDIWYRISTETYGRFINTLHGGKVSGHRDEKFNTYRFADHKGKVIDLLRRVCTVSE